MHDLITTRLELQRVATHVLARRRFAVTGRFGLRATPGGFGTPAFGAPHALEVVRISGTALVHERGGEVDRMPLDGSSLAALAAMVGADLDHDFAAGDDTPALGDRHAPIAVAADAAALLADWYDLGWRALDRVPSAAPTQLWPEHFDAGTHVRFGPDDNDRADLGASPGDHHVEEPYLYVSPWRATDRPGDPAYWNVGFGAARPRSQVPDLAAAVAFFEEGRIRLQP